MKLLEMGAAALPLALAACVNIADDSQSFAIGDAGDSALFVDDFATPPLGSCGLTQPPGPIYHVATTGKDSSGDGSASRPWATIQHALSRVPDGATIRVAPGTYHGSTKLVGAFAQGVLVQSQVPYRALLRTSSGTTLKCYSCSGITVEGFDIAHSSASAGPLVVHLQGSTTRRVTLRNNVIHDSYDNDLVKINNGARFITVTGNLLYNQSGSDEHFDINSATDVVIEDNVLFNAFSASGRPNRNDTSSYVVIKDSNGRNDDLLGAERITIRRNVFASWEGGTGFNFVLVGEDGAPYIEAVDVMIENNLFLGNSDNEMRAPLGVKSGRDVTFRSNTVVGDLPARAYAMRLNAENGSVQNRNVRFYNNVWSDDTGTMQRFSQSPMGHTASFVLDNNLYWNGGAAVPHRSDDLVNRSDDAHGIDADPRLPDPAGKIAPVWNGSSFGDGSADVCEVFHSLVTHYGLPSAGSPIVGKARADKSPDHDILKRPRVNPDLGAVEI